MCDSLASMPITNRPRHTCETRVKAYYQRILIFSTRHKFRKPRYHTHSVPRNNTKRNAFGWQKRKLRRIERLLIMPNIERYVYSFYSSMTVREVLEENVVREKKKKYRETPLTCRSPWGSAILVKRLLFARWMRGRGSRYSNSCLVSGCTINREECLNRICTRTNEKKLK